jgi:hypothetical protein
MKRQLKLSVAAAVIIVALGTLVALFTARADILAPARAPQADPAVNRPASTLVSVRPVVSSSKTLAAVPANLGDLDERHQYALGMIETGNDDREIGGRGEVSRYQIMPSVWRHYSDSLNYRNPQTSLAVAKRHWASLYSSFKQQAHREPTDFDMYVLWNTRYGYYASRSFNPSHLSSSVRDRAQRYVNLVQDGEI